MPYRLRQIELDDKMCQHVSLDVFEPIYPREVICEQLSQHQAWEERERALNMLVMIYVLLAAALWTRLAFPRVLERLARPLQVLGLPWSAMRVAASAISYRRQQLGSAPLQGLFAHCVGRCAARDAGAYRFGRRRWPSRHPAGCGRYASQCRRLPAPQQSIRRWAVSANPPALAQRMW